MDDYTILAMIARVVNFDAWRKEIGALFMDYQVVNNHPLDRDLLLEVLEELGFDDADRRMDYFPYSYANWGMVRAICRLEVSVLTCTCGAEVVQIRPHEDDRGWLSEQADEGVEISIPELGLSAFLCAECISKVERFF